jgi:hypothetical protein
VTTRLIVYCVAAGSTSECVSTVVQRPSQRICEVGTQANSYKCGSQSAVLSDNVNAKAAITKRKKEDVL